MTAAERQLADASGVAAAIARMEDWAAALAAGNERLLVAGIPTRGVSLAARITANLKSRGLPCGEGLVDISMYRDDLGLRGGITAVRGTELPADLERWTVLLVDDVQQTGRTARAAIEAVLAFGRPRRILLSVLADRGGRELPVRPDFTGLELDAAPDQRVRVLLAETDGGREGIFAS
jgi:pyrimidine operon attenuation protein/uracil phosphoribosyltransferase